MPGLVLGRFSTPLMGWVGSGFGYPLRTRSGRLGTSGYGLVGMLCMLYGGHLILLCDSLCSIPVATGYFWFRYLRPVSTVLVETEHVSNAKVFGNYRFGDVLLWE